MDKSFIEISEFNISKSHRAYETGLLAFNDEDYNGALNRAYYSVFHIICAVLILDGKSYKEHSAVLAEFNRIYLKEKIFTEFTFKMIQELSIERNKSDYTEMFWATKEEANEQLINAKLIYDAIEPYIRERINSINCV